MHLLGIERRALSSLNAAQHGHSQECSTSTCRRFQIPLPPLAEQRRIAEVLDRAEALRAKRRAALAQLDSLTQSLFLDLFGDPVTNPRKVGRCDARDYGEVVSDVGKSVDSDKSSDARFVDVGNIDDRVARHDRTLKFDDSRNRSATRSSSSTKRRHFAERRRDYSADTAQMSERLLGTTTAECIRQSYASALTRR